MTDLIRRDCITSFFIRINKTLIGEHLRVVAPSPMIGYTRWEVSGDYDCGK